MDYLSLACQYLSINQEDVLSHRQADDEIVLVVDNGIKGCPKHAIPLSALVKPVTLTPREQCEIPDNLNKRRKSELASIAIGAGITVSTGMTKAEIINALEEKRDGTGTE